MQATAAAQKRAFVGIVGALSSVAAYGAFWQLRNYQESSNRWSKVFSELDEFKATELKGQDAKYYPWVRGSLSDWEYRLVKLQGYFKEERFFVRKTKDGRTGYCVFAPFVTAMDDYDLKKDTNANPMLEYGLMVNLGWVPIENKDDIEMGTEPIPPLDATEEAEDLDLIAEDRHTLLANYPENFIEEHVVGLTEVVGIVKRGENKDLLKGHVNFPYEGVYQYIDLPFMARLFRLFNYESASQAYIERMVPSLEEESEGLYPVPATKDTFFKPPSMPRKHLESASLWGGASLIGLASILLYGLK
jgi:surfeit locus 1 family protein